MGLDLGLSNGPASRPVFGFLWVDLVVTCVSLPGAGRSELLLHNAGQAVVGLRVILRDPERSDWSCGALGASVGGVCKPRNQHHGLSCV